MALFLILVLREGLYSKKYQDSNPLFRGAYIPDYTVAQIDITRLYIKGKGNVKKVRK